MKSPVRPPRFPNQELDIDLEEELNVGPAIPKRKGTVDPGACQCDFPTLALATGEVGPFDHQTVYCSECGYRFFDMVEPQESFTKEQNP